MMTRLKITINSIKILKFRILRLVFLQISAIALLFVLSESVCAQGYLAILKINDPAKVCSPSTVDLTSSAVTSGSSEGLLFSYFMNPELTVSVSNPTAVKGGIYYIKGTLTGSSAVWVAGSVKVAVFEKPKMVILNSISKISNQNVDLTVPQIKSGSDEGLIFSYWYDYEATKPLLTPESTGTGKYFIKGTTSNGCFDIQSVNVIE